MQNENLNYKKRAQKKDIYTMSFKLSVVRERVKDEPDRFMRDSSKIWQS